MNKQPVNRDNGEREKVYQDGTVQIGFEGKKSDAKEWHGDKLTSN